MIRCLKDSLNLDITYSINSFLFILRKLPILKDLLTEDVYKSKTIKSIIRYIVLIYYLIRDVALKFFYFFVIFSLSYYFFFDHMVSSYFHYYFVLALMGIFLNNKLLNTSKKKYFSLFLFHMDGTEFFRANLFWNQISNLILNAICIFFFGHLIQSPIIYSIMLLVLSFSTRLIGETFNIMFFRKKKYIWFSNSKLYGLLFLIFIPILGLPYFNIYIPIKGILISTIIITILGGISFSYLLKVKDYKLLYRRLSQMTQVMNSRNDKDYYRQAMVSVREKDKVLSSDKIKGKKGYDLFNTIFFERHKEILIRSAKKYSFILIGIYLLLFYFSKINLSVENTISLLLNQKLGWFVVIMYFINRGAIITQAMFFNCDHAMLSYNFYREPKVLLNNFKKRLLTVIKVNLLPASIIGIGNTILLITISKANILTLVTTFLFILFLSIFFSVHYLVIYYLLQPFNKDLEVKKASYSFATFITYFVSYYLTNVVMDSLSFSIFGLLGTILYILISLYLVYRYAPKTFKLN